MDAHRVPMLGSCALAVAVLTFFASASEPRAQAAISSAAAATSNLASRAMPPPGVEFDATMRGRILQQSPLPAPPKDPTNRFADDENAARFGQALFFDTRLSKNGLHSCATCHDPDKGFADGRSLAEGAHVGRRHSPSIYNSAHQRWLFWDGRADSAWSQALQPIENELELDLDRVAVARLVAGDSVLRSAYTRTFGAIADVSKLPAHAKPTTSAGEIDLANAWNAMEAAERESVNRVFANVGKSLAAYERLLTSTTSAFDRFASALRRDDAEAQKLYPDAAKRGLALFVGKANCRLCHAGPLFSDGEFHNIGVPTLDRKPPRDAGRREGIERLQRDPFNAAGAFSDDPEGEHAREIAQLAATADTWGQFRTPSLRNVARTAPYMHQGQFATLGDVLHYYSTLEGTVPAGHHGEQVMKALALGTGEIADIEAFLESLTDESLPKALRAPPARASIEDLPRRAGR